MKWKSNFFGPLILIDLKAIFGKILPNLGHATLIYHRGSHHGNKSLISKVCIFSGPYQYKNRKQVFTQRTFPALPPPPAIRLDRWRAGVGRAASGGWRRGADPHMVAPRLHSTVFFFKFCDAAVRPKSWGVARGQAGRGCSRWRGLSPPRLIPPGGLPFCATLCRHPPPATRHPPPSCALGICPTPLPEKLVALL